MELFYTSPTGGTVDLINDPEMILISQTGLASLPDNVITAQELVSLEGDFVSNRRRSARSINLSYNVFGNAKAKRREVAEVLSQYAQGKIVYRDEELDVFIPVDVETCEIDPMANPVTVTIGFRANYPYFMDSEPNSDTNVTSTKEWRFPFTFPVTFGNTVVGSELVVENDSDLDVPFVWRVVAREQMSSNALEFAGQRLEFTTSLAKGETLEVDVATRTAWRIDSEGTRHNALPDRVVGSRFFNLPPGLQTLTYEGTGACTVEARVLRKGI